MAVFGLLCAVAAGGVPPAYALEKPRHVPAKAKIHDKDVLAARLSDAAAQLDWQRAFALMADKSNPVTPKLMTWIYVTRTNLPVDPKQMMAFVRENPQWPKLYVFRDAIEESLGNGTFTPQQIIDWCDQNPPATYDGIRVYLDALIHFNQVEKAKTALAAFWESATLDRSQTASLLSNYRRYLAAGANGARLDALIWAGRYDEAQYMLPFVADDARALGRARIALAKMSQNVDALVNAVPPALQKDEGLLYERLRWRRRHNQDDAAILLLSTMPRHAAHPERWWAEQNILMRRQMKNHDYKSAYAVIAPHKLSAGGLEFAQAEWLAGWLELRYLNKPLDAYRHFDTLYRNVGASVSRSRAAYWAARAADALPDRTLARQWDKTASQYLSTYYGQLSYDRVYGRPTSGAIGETAADALQWQAYQKGELAQAVQILAKLNLARLADPFLAKLAAQAKTRADFKMVAALAREAGLLQFAVQANKDIQVKLGQFLFIDGYPVISALPAHTPEKALIHAVIHRESMFNPLAVSPVGARGLMQLMPATAKMVARRQGETFNTKRLTADPRYNILIGSAYLKKLLDYYDGYYPLAIAAYNAGPNNVDEWLQTFGDPRKGDMDIVDWIEHIPNYETRNYVQRVLETYYMYRLRFGEKPLTVTDFKAE